MSWLPLYDDSSDTRLSAAMASIVAELSNGPLIQVCGPSLSGGSAGVALFFSYLAAAHPDQGWSSHASSYLQHSVAHSQSVAHSSGLFAGATGIAWTVEHLRRFGVAVDLDPREEIDTRLLHELESEPTKHDHDLVKGVVGMGVYALERPRTSGRQLLERVIERLEASATHLPGGVAWFTAPELIGGLVSEHPEGYYNLGLAHGLAGVLTLLAQAVTADVGRAHATALLEQAIRWLLAQRNENDARWSFPPHLSGHPPTLRAQGSRVAWCNGDLGIATALYLAATALNEPTWARDALDVARRAAQCPPAYAGVVDAGLCHGAAGNGHIFNRLYQATRDPAFELASRRWFNQVLRLYEPGRGLGAFRAWRSDSDGNGRWLWLPGFIEGAAGVGLALLSATTAIEPDWDRTLQVAIPPRPGA